MACLVPDFPAVLLTLEHLSDLEKQLKDEDIPFSEEASHHLREISSAIKELEASRQAAHEQLEVQTIENGKMRHHAYRVRDAITKEMREGVAAARDVNVTQLNKLQSDLARLVEEIASVQTEQITLGERNAELYKLREPMKKQHGDGIRQLNCVLSGKARHQILLNKKLNEIENLKDEIGGVEDVREELRMDMAQERQKFKEAKGAVEAQIQEQMNRNEEQKNANHQTRRELNSLVSERYQTEDREVGLRKSINQIQTSKNKLTAARKTLKEKLAMERKRVEEYKKERASHEKQLAEVKETFRKKQQSLQQNITESENYIKRCNDMSEIQAAKIDGLMKYFNIRRKVEDNVMAEHTAIAKRMQWSKSQLEERITATAKYKTEVREMEQAITMLEDSSGVNSELLARGLENTEQQLTREKNNRVEHEEEIVSLEKALEELKVSHKERMRQIGQDTVQTEQRSAQLRQEEKKLQSHVYLTSIIDRLKQMIANTKQATKDMEVSFNEELQGIEEETAVVSQQHAELQELLEAELAVLSSVEGEFDFDQSRHVNLTKETADLKYEKMELEVSVQSTVDETAWMLRPKEEIKVELVDMRRKHMDLLRSNVEKIAKTERAIYNNAVMLEKVNQENHHFRTCIAQMKEDVAHAQHDKVRHAQEAERLQEQDHALFQGLLDAWVNDLDVVKEYNDKDRQIYQGLQNLVLKIESRQNNLGGISNNIRKETEGLTALLSSPKIQ
ncbi:filamin-A-interacting protein 1-like [Engraulis encrasicolus]|uniref:filamin-A-interacting protein 1-like n=1 Tax=Engraulis encrasicolus TaxID=184585 RepID=UPI002FD18BBC